MARISACVIAKNEEESLPFWLDSMRRIADEMVVVDTGSQDRTVALATAAGAKVVSFPWIDDFAAAKNFALDQAEGDWIVFLDADEYIPSEDCPNVRAAIEKYDQNPKIAGLILYCVNIDKDTGQDLGSSCYLIRCFRHRSWLRYVDRIHESLQDLSGRGLRIMQYVPGITIYHTGYSTALMPQKLQRNIALIRKMQKLDGEKDIDFFHLADCYYGLRDYEQAIACSREAIVRDVRPGGMENRPHTLLIHSLMLGRHPSEEIEDALVEAARRYPQAAEFPMLWGIFDWERRDYGAAEAHFLEGLRLFRAEQNSGMQRQLLASHSINFLPTVYGCLGEIAFWRKRPQEAMDFLVESLKLQRRNLHALKLLCKLMGQSPPADAICLLNGLYRPEDRDILLQALSGAGLDQVELYYARKGGFPPDAFKGYLCAGNLCAAAAALVDSAENLDDLGSCLQLMGGAASAMLPEVYCRAAEADGFGGKAEERIRRKWDRMGAYGGQDCRAVSAIG